MEEFLLKAVDPKYHAGEEYCIKSIGLTKIDDLTSQ